MANPRSTLGVGLTAAAGLAALYFGVCFLIDGLKAIHAGNKLRNSSEYKSFSAIAESMENHHSSNPATGMLRGFDNINKSTIRYRRLFGLGSAAAGGLLLFGTYAAGRSLATGSEMTNAETLINAGALVAGAVKAFNHI